ncbi:hypothetical protein KP509_12G005100 [Ceratopteris richardii]|uniref:Uncharacterized protein n=1 Tax=Ceratopteris richardii TaxID=49495 RepID=A0A8T2TLT1_CERRI|nr:hypothetical protein KP509_12G005100 [Ceratopteris richardii]
MEDIGKLSWFKACRSKANMIIMFFTTKVKVLAMGIATLRLRSRSSQDLHICGLYFQDCLRFRFLLGKRWLVGCGLSDEYGLEEFKRIQKICLEENFWESIKVILGAITLIYKVLRMMDCEGATLVLLVHFMRQAMQHINACDIVT